MKIYNAINPNVLEQNYNLGRVLVSFAYCKSQVSVDRVHKAIASGMDIFIDSGAFTAHNSGNPISVEDYAKFLMSLPRALPFANMDSVRSAKETFQNQQKLEAMGLRPLPVFHLNEDVSYLKRYLDSHDYICIAGNASLRFFNTSPRFWSWVSGCFHYIGKKDMQRVHMFGVSSLSVFQEFPFYSADSSSALYGGKAGMLLSKDFEWVTMIRPSMRHALPTVYQHRRHVSSDEDRNRINFNRLREMEEYVTRLWERRGLKWKEWEPPSLPSQLDTSGSTSPSSGRRRGTTRKTTRRQPPN